MHTDTLIWLFPIVFMLHDFEEIIMMAPWVKKNRAELERRWPRLAPRMLALTGGLSTPAFALAVAILFAFISGLTVLVVELRLYALWGAMLLVFALHFLAHIAQWIVLRRYVPVIITSGLGAAYCALAFFHLLSIMLVSWAGILIYLLPVVIFTAIVLALSVTAARCFDRWLITYTG
jgi:hypothetical protein